MNAAEQAKTVTTVSKLAALANLFKAEFPRVSIDLKPWNDDPETRDLIDPDSIDLGVHFPGTSKLCASRCILLQIRFHTDPEAGDRQAIGLEAMGYDHRGQQWRFSTVDNWQFHGRLQPQPEGAEKLKGIFRSTYELFTV